jgi:hypothetical protein
MALKIRYSSTKMAAATIGTTMSSRCVARTWFSNWPPYSIE